LTNAADTGISRGEVVAGKITNVTIFVWRMCGKSGGIDIRISVMI
jgi:hypothetical protein